MATADQFEFGAVYDLVTYAPNVLGTFKGVRVFGIIDSQGAYAYIDPAARHASVYSSLPSGAAENDFRSYYYVLLEYPNGTKTALGIPWIDGAQVTKIDYYSARVIIEDVGPDSLEQIRLALQSNGFQVGSLELTS